MDPALSERLANARPVLSPAADGQGKATTVPHRCAVHRPRPADRPYVFDRFYRATAARGMPGSGLGLAIVAQTAAQHGGTVTVEPNTPHGTLVTIRLSSNS
jgi:light-regulated signal transduction histidine kinase (bacteriophytochrome)